MNYKNKETGEVVEMTDFSENAQEYFGKLTGELCPTEDDCIIKDANGDILVLTKDHFQNNYEQTKNKEGV